jgi:phosphoglucomutase
MHANRPSAAAVSPLAGQPAPRELLIDPAGLEREYYQRRPAANGWFAARPSGTENIYKIYAESFKGEAHLRAIVQEARQIVTRALGA